MYYTNLDLAFGSGLVDGLYQEGEGLVLLPKYLYQGSVGVKNFIIAYSAAYNYCNPISVALTEKRLGDLLKKLADEETRTGVFSWLKKQWYSVNGGLFEGHKQYCEKATVLRNEISDFVEYIKEYENIKALYSSVKTELSNYFIIL